MAVSNEEVQSRFGRVFVEVQAAEKAGGDTQPLAAKLNNILRLLDAGSPSDVDAADALLTEVQSQVRIIYAEGVSATNTQYIIIGVTLVVLAGAILLVWFFGSGIIWTAWERTKKGWVVKAR